MFNQFPNTSNWLEDDIMIAPGECYELYFKDTCPNQYYIQNPNSTRLHVGISKLPTEENYEFCIGENASESVARPVGAKFLYLLNVGTVSANVKIFSYNGEFDLSLLNTVNLNVDSIPVDVEEQITIKGFLSGASIPSGTNTIGKVEPGATLTDLLNTLISQQSDNGDVAENALTVSKGHTDVLKDILTANQQTQSNTDLLSDILTANQQLASALAGADIDGVEGVGLIEGLLKKNTNSNIIYKYLPTDSNDEVIGAAVSRNYLLNVSNGNTTTKTTIAKIYDLNGMSYNITFLGTSNATRVTVYLETSDDTYRFTPKTVDYNGKKFIFLSQLELDTYVDITDSTICIRAYDGFYYERAIACSKSYYSGILANLPIVVKNPKNSGGYIITAGNITTIKDDNSNKSFPIPVFNKISKIYMLDASKPVTVNIYYSYTEYYSLVMSATESIENIEHDVYKVELINSNSNDVTVYIIGGLYD